MSYLFYNISTGTGPVAQFLRDRMVVTCVHGRRGSSG